jgi:heme oxygenase
MSNLKELTWEHHKAAERQAFVKELFGGISEERYATFLFNLHPIYNTLEMFAMLHGIFDGYPELRRAPRIHADYGELWREEFKQPALLKCVREYMDHLMSIKDDKEKIMAHVYVRHMGDLSGGQMIAKKIPGSGTMYEFDKPVDELKEHIRSQINDDMADEAKLAFDYATRLFQEMEGLVTV